MEQHVYEVFRNLVAFTAVHYVSNNFIFKPLAAKYIPIKGSLKTKANKAQAQKQQKFVSSSWKFFSYVFLVAYGFWAIRDQQDWFWSPLKYHDQFPGNKYPAAISRLYKLEIAYYVFSQLVMFTEPRMKDFWAMFAHHFFTLTLLISSYKFGAVKYGTAIMLLHDVADPIMEIAKIALYLDFEMLANIFFACFMVVFVVLRDYVYPRHIIWNTYILLWKNKYEFRHVTISCLVALWLLHLFWTVLIFKVAAKALSGNQEGDIRDNDD